MAPITVRIEVRIKAPAEEVWKTLTDTSTWPQWNPFIPQADIMDEKDRLSSIEPQFWALDSRRRFCVNMNGRKMESIQKVTVLEVPDTSKPGPRKYRICWEEQNYPDLIFHTLRYNEIEHVDDSECIYRTGEDQNGPVAYLVKLLFGKQVEKGLNDWTNGLKAYMETERDVTSGVPVPSGQQVC